MAENFGATDKISKDAVLSMLPAQRPMRALIRNNHFEPFVQVDIEAFYEKQKNIFIFWLHAKEK